MTLPISTCPMGNTIRDGPCKYNVSVRKMKIGHVYAPSALHYTSPYYDKKS